MKTMLKPYKFATVAGEYLALEFFIRCPAVHATKKTGPGLQDNGERKKFRKVTEV